jgi:hypothetical protein
MPVDVAAKGLQKRKQGKVNGRNQCRNHAPGLPLKNRKVVFPPLTVVFSVSQCKCRVEVYTHWVGRHVELD